MVLGIWWGALGKSGGQELWQCFSCVTLGQSLTFSEPQFPQLQEKE